MRRLLWLNLPMAGSAAGWVVVTLIALELPFDWPLIALAFLLALGFYTRDRLQQGEQESDRLAMPERTAWIERHAARLKWLVWGCFGGAVALVLLRPAAAPPLLAGLGFALSYTVRWIPWPGRRLGWKHLPGMKMPFVAALWTLTTVITPAAVYGRLRGPETWLLAGAVCLLIMVQILLNDLRDVAADRAAGTRSLPVLAGEAAARYTGGGLMAMAVLLASPVAAIPFALTGLYSLLLLYRYRYEEDAGWRFWIEAQGIVAAVCIILIHLPNGPIVLSSPK
jgi:4-hydroxybenzoate polyprenyltransferase